ncbi:unnamed protein product [Polarella glacialis]|uniref:Uncharacterized protein n=1 Tax=Polarella glacialis TaxID=89957 RepID=A0A813KDC5_POLGL|nr:unnamed protein product [Polarella glacialis]
MQGPSVAHSAVLFLPLSEGFLILRCRLFLSWRRRSPEVSDCSPANRERELGLDGRATGSPGWRLASVLQPARRWSLGRGSGNAGTLRRISAEFQLTSLGSVRLYPEK